MNRAEIKMKLPSLNDYIDACRTNRYVAAKMKRETEDAIIWFIKRLPKFQDPVVVHFVWVEADRKRDPDNIAFAKKFVFDALVKARKLKDDSQRYVKGFTDDFRHGKETKLILFIEEVET